MKIRLKVSLLKIDLIPKKLYVSKFEIVFYGQVYSGGPSSSKCEFFSLCLALLSVERVGYFFHTLKLRFPNNISVEQVSCSAWLLVLQILRACIVIES